MPRKSASTIQKHSGVPDVAFQKGLAREVGEACDKWLAENEDPGSKPFFMNRNRKPSNEKKSA